jgi:hypothetical protein
MRAAIKINFGSKTKKGMQLKFYKAWHCHD